MMIRKLKEFPYASRKENINERTAKSHPVNVKNLHQRISDTKVQPVINLMTNKSAHSLHFSDVDLEIFCKDDLSTCLIF